MSISMIGLDTAPARRRSGTVGRLRVNGRRQPSFSRAIGR
jgi:hypothetical protein